jgi:hypothetical protein
VVLQDLGDGTRRQTHAKFAEFTLDAPVAPERILPGQACDEGNHLFVDGRAARQAMRVRPPSGHQPAVSGNQGCRRHAEGSPGRTGEQAAECGQQSTIGRLIGRTPDVAPKHLHFVAQGEDLGILGPLPEGP